MPSALNHLSVVGFTESQEFKSPRQVVRPAPPDRERHQHGNRLLAQLRALEVEVKDLQDLRAKAGQLDAGGVAIALEISPAGFLDFGKKLEWKRDGIEVLSALPARDGAEVVTLYVPNGKLTAFEGRVKEYLEVDRPAKKEGQPPRPAHASLINVITSFRRAVFQELWTDEGAPPGLRDQRAFQVWLRQGERSPKEVFASFVERAAKLKMKVATGYVCFPGRVVALVETTRTDLQDAFDLLEDVAEIRGTAPTAEYFLSQLRPHELAPWVKDLAQRTKLGAVSDETPFVTLLDTGVNHQHPLLSSAIDGNDLHAVVDAWDNHDHHGHGTSMAGLALLGDLRTPLASKEAIELGHRLESVKILPPHGANSPHLYGWVVDAAAGRVEDVHDVRRRTFAMMTTAFGQTTGMPTEWSATVDRLAFGLQGESANPFDLPSVMDERPVLHPRLFVLSAGNIDWAEWHKYPTNNDLQTVEDPAQAWNALAVGAYTEQVEFDTAKWPSLELIAPHGGLAPASRTSVTWSRAWPHKPDVVAEGGNGCIDTRAKASVVVGPEDLRILTTSHDMTKALLTESGDTSAAAAEVARLCAQLNVRYPQYWPETIRALIVNGADYTSEMRRILSKPSTQHEREALVGRFGYGKVSLDMAINSTTTRPTLVLQEELSPYLLDEGSTKLGKVNIHELPWPRAELEALGGASVELKITLSYFIHPNPSRRGWQSKFRYQSHGLRFAVRGSTESPASFHQRINKVDRDLAGNDESMPDPDNERWLLRYNVRSRGSLHCDTWSGLASELANKSEIAVFPVGGWWKDMGRGVGTGWKMRYALVLSLNVLTDADVDIYTPIANAIAIAIDNG